MSATSLGGMTRARHDPGRRLDRGDPAAVGRVAQRAADVVAEPERAHPGGDRRRLAAARAAGGDVGVPRVPGHPVQRRIGLHPQAEVGQVRPPEQDRPCRPHPLDDRRVHRRDRLRTPRHPRGRRAGDVDVLLHRERHAVQRTERQPVGHRPIGVGGLVGGARERGRDHRVERPVHVLDASEQAGEHLRARHLLPGDEVGQFQPPCASRGRSRVRSCPNSSGTRQDAADRSRPDGASVGRGAAGEPAGARDRDVGLVDGPRVRALGRPVTLADVPDDVWDDVAGPGRRRRVVDGRVAAQPSGCGGRAIRCRDGRRRPVARCPTSTSTAMSSAPPTASATTWSTSTSAATPGWRRPEPRSAARGVGLVLDFVPNHVAPDHPWVDRAPRVVRPRGRPGGGARSGRFLRRRRRGHRRGRDPYFPPWPDVLSSTPRCRRWAAAAGAARFDRRRCDAVRCDMAMLMLDDVFARTWGDRPGGGAVPDGGRGYWPTVLAAVRSRHPGPGVLGRGLLGPRTGARRAGLRCVLRQAPVRPARGARAPAGSIRAHLGADPAYQAHTVALRREPRRAAARAAELPRRGDGGCGRRPHPARRRPGARGAVGRSTGPCAGDARSASGRAARRRAPDVVRAVLGGPGAASVAVSGRWSPSTAGPTTGRASASSPGSGRQGRRSATHLVVVNLSDRRADGRVRLGTRRRRRSCSPTG